MKFPLKVIENLSSSQIDQWNKYYIATETHNPKIEEGIWRRTQSIENKEESGWKSESDCRRRMLHYRHKFDVEVSDGTHDLVLKETYLRVNYCVPSDETQDYTNELLMEICKTWKRVEIEKNNEFYREHFLQGDLHLKIEIYKKHPEDVMAGRKFPNNYESVDISIFSDSPTIDEELRKKPWNILSTGFRKKDERKAPNLENSVQKIIGLLPAQVELGCGPSIEAGIPPLDFLHEVYCVANRKNKKPNFCFTKDFLLAEIVKNPNEAFVIMTEMYRRCFMSQPTKFYDILKKLSDEKLIVGDVITNNFDGLATRVGLREEYVRRYESDHIIPDIKFHPLAKSLIVVGSHADRRKIHHAAREQGLVVVHVDPEGYYTEGGFEPYPLEDVLEDDILFRETATKAFEQIYDQIKIKK